MRPHIGFIGQGWIGKTYSDDLERRGFDVVRYAQEVPYVHRAGEIAGCDIVFVAVPTPTTPRGFDDSIVRSDLVADDLGTAVFDSLTAKNIDLLLGSEKDLDLLHGVHGDDVASRPRSHVRPDAPACVFPSCDAEGDRLW